MRLIDADPLKDKEFNVYDAEHEEWYRAVKSDDIETAPTIDAVPVVRCKDCKWCFGDLDENNNAVFSCEQWNEQKTDPNGFCFAGVRREQNATD